MEFPTRWLCCTGKQSCESRSCDRISTYRTRKKEKCRPSAQERNTSSQTQHTKYPAKARQLCPPSLHLFASALLRAHDFI